MNVEEWVGKAPASEIVEQAIDWIVLLDGNIDRAVTSSRENNEDQSVELGLVKLDESKRAEFFMWLNKDVSHQYLFAECSELWAKTSCIKSLQEQLNTSNILQFPHGDRNTRLHSDGNVTIMSEYYSSVAAPAWAYRLVISLISFGMLIPLIF